MRGRLACVVCALVCHAGQGGSSIREVVALVRAAIQNHQPEKQLVRELHKARLNERLENRVVEELESEGAPPKALSELERLRDVTRSLSLPAQPVEFDSPPQPSGDEQAAIIEDARQNALNYSKTLPDFICTEMIHRYEDPTGTESWIPRDILTVKLSYFEQTEDYKLTAINDRPTRKGYMSVEGASSSGEFGTLLRHIFEPESRVAFAWDHWTVLRKRPAHVYRFQVPPQRSHYVLEFETNSGHARAAAGTHGFVYVDRETRMIVRLVREADSLPAKFPIQRASSFVDYGFTDVGGRPALLPVRAGLIMQYSKLLTRNEVFFESYRKFTAEAAISFEDPDQGKAPPKP